MTVATTPAQGLYLAVSSMTPEARTRIVRLAMIGWQADDVAEWRRLVEAEKKRRQRDFVPMVQRERAGQIPAVPVAPPEPAGQSGNVPLVSSEPAGQPAASASPQTPPPPAPSPGPPSPPTPAPTREIPAREMQPDGSRKTRPDSLVQVTARCAALGLPDTDAEAIWCKWQGNGFTNDRKPMKDWWAVIRSWQLHGYLPSQKTRAGPGATGTHRPPPIDMSKPITAF